MCMATIMYDSILSDWYVKRESKEHTVYPVANIQSYQAVPHALQYNSLINNSHISFAIASRYDIFCIMNILHDVCFTVV